MLVFVLKLQHWGIFFIIIIISNSQTRMQLSAPITNSALHTYVHLPGVTCLKYNKTNYKQNTTNKKEESGPRQPTRFNMCKHLPAEWITLRSEHMIQCFYSFMWSPGILLGLFMHLSARSADLRAAYSVLSTSLSLVQLPWSSRASAAAQQ